MITAESLTDYIRRAISDAKVSVTDRTGTMDHFSIRVVSDLFKGKDLLDRHRLIYNALNEPMKDGRIHALEIKAETTMEDRGGSIMADPIEEEIQQEIKKHKILIYGKGTKAMPMCGFTRETMQFFDQYGYPYEVIDVLPNPAKRETLTKMTNWPTLPKVFINGQFYGDTDILEPMEKKGELEPLLKDAFKNS
jgi:monothiol glutaredoxin